MGEFAEDISPDAEPSPEALKTSSRELSEQQLRLECIGLNEAGELVRIPGEDPDDIGSLLVVRNENEYVAYLNAELPPEVKQRLRSIDLREGFDSPGEVHEALGELGQVETRWKGFVFNSMPNASEFLQARLLGTNDASLLKSLDPQADPSKRTFGLFVGGELVAACVSSRENDESAEAWVQTKPDQRGRGYAKQAAKAWAADVMTQGKTAFYSHLADNEASAGLAAALHLAPVAEGVWFSPPKTESTNSHDPEE